MASFKRKPATVQAITFDQLVQHGRDSEANIVHGMPWSFHYKGLPVSHENDECYLITTSVGTVHLTPKDMLVTTENGGTYSQPVEMFLEAYEPV